MNKHRSARWARFTAVIAVIFLFALIGCQLQVTEPPLSAQDGADFSASAQAAVPANPPAWDANTLYSRAGLYVTHKGKVWVSQWYITRGAEPGANAWNGWKSADVPSMDRNNPKPWIATVNYNAKGYYVKHRGRLWVSQWSITRGAEPGANAWNGWKSVDPPRWVSVSARGSYTLALNNKGRLYAWGNNSSGRLGDGTTTDRSTPTRVGTASNWARISPGSGHSLAINTKGELYAWGGNNYGRLGDGTTTARKTPTRIGTASNWEHIAVGRSFNLAINKDGELYAWGRNSLGQLGDNTETDRHRPTRIGTASNWTDIAAGYNHSLALNSNGELYAWGNGKSKKPTRIGTASGWKSIAAGRVHAFAISGRDELYAWGSNNFGQLGDGTTTRQSEPKKIGSSTWSQVLSWYHTLAINKNGELYGWGYNRNGRVGDGTTTNRSTPVQIGSASDWTSVSAGGGHSMAVNSKGELYAWGLNSSGQLGDGTTTNRSAPIKIEHP